MPVDRERGAGKGCGTKGRFVYALAGIGETSPVPANHFDISEQMMTERDRLCGLQMREPRQNGIHMGFRLLDKRPLQILQLMVERVDGIAHPQSEISRDLIVTAASRMEAARRLTDLLRQCRFHVHVDILERGLEFEGARLDVLKDSIQSGEDGVAVGGGDDFAVDQHLAMSLGAGNVLGVETTIKIDGGVDTLHDFCRAGGVAAAPYGVAAHDEKPGVIELTKGRILLLPLIAALFHVLVLQTALADKGPPLTGWMEKFTVNAEAGPAPTVSLIDGTGSPVRLSDFKGRVVLVNFWATWCAPCIREMPGLDKLEAKLGGPDFTVVAINEDRGGAKIAESFLEKLNTPNLRLYLDDKMKLMRAFGVRGMPTSFLLDRAGNVVGKLEGIAEWDTPEVEALIQYYIERSAAARRAAPLVPISG